MTVLEALAVLDAATRECKRRDINTPEVRAALDFLEPHIKPAWLIPQFRHHIARERDNDHEKEGQQQVLRATFPGIRESVKELIGKQMDALARQFAATHEMKAKDEIDRLAREYGKLKSRGGLWRAKATGGSCARNGLMSRVTEAPKSYVTDLCSRSPQDDDCSEPLAVSLFDHKRSRHRIANSPDKMTLHKKSAGSIY
jgi:hypothetical protein